MDLWDESLASTQAVLTSVLKCLKELMSHLIFVLVFCIGASFPCSVECKLDKTYIFPSVPPKPIFIRIVTKTIFNRKRSEKSKALGELVEK